MYDDKTDMFLFGGTFLWFHASAEFFCARFLQNSSELIKFFFFETEAKDLPQSIN
jgi:hypothetical protein